MISFNNKVKITLFSILILLTSVGCNNLISNFPNSYYLNSEPIAVMTVPNKDRIDIINMRSNRVSASISTKKRPTGIAVDPEQELIMVSNYDSGDLSFYSIRAKYINENKFKDLGVVGHGLNPDGVTFNPNPNIKEAYAVYKGDSKMLILDTKDRNSLPKIISTYDLKGYSPKEIAVTKDGSKIYITDNLSGKLIILKRDKNSFTKTELPLIENLEHVPYKDELLLDGIFIDNKNTSINSKNQEVTLGSDRVFIASPAQDNIIVVKDDKVETTISLKEDSINLDKPEIRIGPKNMTIYRNVEKDIEKLYVTGNNASVVSVIDLKTLKLMKTIQLTQNPNTKDGYNPIGIGLAYIGKDFVSNRDLVYVTNNSGLQISMINIEDDTLMRTTGDYCCYEQLGELVTLGVKTDY